MVRGDWDDPYLTLSPQYQARQIEAFGKIAGRRIGKVRVQRLIKEPIDEVKKDE